MPSVGLPVFSCWPLCFGVFSYVLEGYGVTGVETEFVTVFGGLFCLGLTAGFFMHRSDFCLAGALRDLFLFRSARLIRPLVFAVAVSALLFELARLTGLLPYYPFPGFGVPAGATLVGGFVFGVGMVLTGACVVGVLYKLGGGSLLAGVGLLGLIVGSGLYAEIHPYWQPLAKASRWHEQAVTLPQLTGTSPTGWALGLAGAGFLLCAIWWQQGKWSQGYTPEGFVPLWLTAGIIAILSLLALLLSGVPMGITTSYAKFAAGVEQLFVPEHVAATEFFTARAFQLAPPPIGRVLTGGGGPQFDVIALIQYPLIVGIPLGAFFSALRLGEFKPHWKVPVGQALMVFCGGIIMAFGSRLAPGCNVWHLLGGLPLLTMQSLLFLAGLLPGAWVGSRLLQKFLV